MARTEHNIERRRTIRIRRSSLTKNKLESIDRPSIKIAETFEEYEQSFRLVYQEYDSLGYISRPHPHRLHYSIHTLLPQTCIFLFKEYKTVVSTLTQIADTELFGLPMDVLYKDEIDALRDQGRKIVEISALATPSEKRWHNLLVYLAKAYFQYANMAGVNDLVIMVNPKHVAFYKAVFMFKEFGEEKMYDAVSAPAVALRINYDTFWDDMAEAFDTEEDFETNLYEFFHKVCDTKTPVDKYMRFEEKCEPLDYGAARYFFSQRPEILRALTPEQFEYVARYYHKALFAEGIAI